MMVEVDIKTGKEIVKTDITIPVHVKTREEVFQHFDTLTREFIRETIRAFDIVNDTTFKDIEAFTKYTYDVNDPRYPLSMSFLTWNSAVWDAVIIQRDAYLNTLVIPSDADFLAALPIKG